MLRRWNVNRFIAQRPKTLEIIIERITTRVVSRNAWVGFRLWNFAYDSSESHGPKHGGFWCVCNGSVLLLLRVDYLCSSTRI